SYLARHVAPYSANLERVDFHIPSRLPGPRPFRIGFVTDTHIGPVVRPGDIERALSLLVDAKPDLLAFGGDYVSESPRYIAEAAAVLGNFVATARHGALAVLGNHDYANDASRLMKHFERRGIQVLRNQSQRVAAPCGDLWIAGIDDALLGAPDLRLAFADVPADAAALALWHEPDWAEHVAPFGAFLQLSGHSHGGQIRLPILGNVAAPSGGRRFVAGLQQAAGLPIYTSRGIGVYRPPIRFRCPPEVTLITLR
ncbi:MAG: metallophosphoesterase, partial [Thermomicrobiales bacterium]